MPRGRACVRVGEVVIVSIVAWRDDNGWHRMMIESSTAEDMDARFLVAVGECERRSGRDRKSG
jgi:hypothetical protein